MLKQLFISTLAGFLFVACGSDPKDKPVELKTFKDKLSYSLGADHAHAISESKDPNFSKYDLAEIVKGFEIGLQDENAFDDVCKATMKELLGEDGMTFNTAKAKTGSNCIGKLSASFFYQGWKQKDALDKIDMKMVLVGFEQGLRSIDTLVPRVEQGSMIQDFVVDLNKLNGIKMLEKVAQKPNTTTTASGLVLEKIQEGKGGSPLASDDILVHYILMNAHGDTLQSSFEMVDKYKQPLKPFSLLEMLPGWQEGIPMMKKGGKYHLYVPFHLAYGQQGMYNQQTGRYDIQPYETLAFYIELLDYGKAGTLK